MRKINCIIYKSINPEWLKNVELTLNGFKFNDKKNMVQIEALVSQERFDYGEPGVRNKGQSFIIYAENIKKEQMSTLKLDRKIRINQVTNISTYGEYNNNMSVTGSVNFYD